MKLKLALALLTAGAMALALADEVTVKIGFAGPLTGPIAHLGKDEQYGAQMALDDANGKGVTIGGKKVKFELVAEDDQGDPRAATVVAQRLVDLGAKGVVGHVTSGTSIPASRLYERAGIPMISPSSTSPKLTAQGYKTAFRVIANDFDQAAPISRLAGSVLKLKRLVIIDDRTAYGQGVADTVEAALKKVGVGIVGREFTSDKATDFSSILTKIKALRPDAIFYGGMDVQAAPMLRQMKQLGLEAKLIGADGLCTTDFVKLAGDAMSGDVYCTRAGIPMERMPAGADFKQRFQKRFGVEVQLYAPYAYDAAMAVVEAMKAANSTDPATFLPAMKTINFKGITGPVAFDAHGDIKGGAATLYQFRGGKYEPMDVK